MSKMPISFSFGSFTFFLRVEWAMSLDDTMHCVMVTDEISNEAVYQKNISGF